MPQMPQMASPAPQSGIIWVQGESAARAYNVAPNAAVQLWDSDAPVIYLKSADANGIPSIRIIDYTFRDAAAPAPVQRPAPQEYVTTDAFQAFRNDIEARIRALSKKGEVAHDESDANDA